MQILLENTCVVKSEFCEISKNTFFTEHVWATAFVWNNVLVIFQECRSHSPKVFLGKGVLKLCSKFTAEHPFLKVILISCFAFIEITLRHGCSPVNLLHILKISLYKSTYGGLFLEVETSNSYHNTRKP